jgi:hypothetical protein
VSDLTLLWPRPEPVTVGGDPFLAVCFQLQDLARLQGLARGFLPHPLAGHRVAILQARAACPGGDYLGDTEEGRRYAGLLRPALVAAQRWAAPGEPGGAALLASDAGLVLWLDVLLSRCNPGFTAATAARLLPEMTLEERLHLQAVAYADHPLDEWLRIAEPAPRRRGEFDWAREVVEFGEERGWTPEEVGRLYLSQWWLWRSGGKATSGRIVGDRTRRRRIEQRTRQLLRCEPGSNGTGGMDVTGPPA